MDTALREVRPRVLLADDYRGVVATWQRVLEFSCDIVGTVSDGRAVLETAGRLNPDVIVLDVNLGGANGLDLCRGIKQKLPPIQVVLVSATVTDELQDAAHDAGASSFVSKFAGISALESAIRRAYGMRGCDRCLLSMEQVSLSVERAKTSSTDGGHSHESRARYALHRCSHANVPPLP
jgi:two-component system response regulator DesR